MVCAPRKKVVASLLPSFRRYHRTGCAAIRSAFTRMVRFELTERDVKQAAGLRMGIRVKQREDYILESSAGISERRDKNRKFTLQ